MLRKWINSTKLEAVYDSFSPLSFHVIHMFLCIEEIKSLTAEVASLRKENSRLREEVSALKQENAVLKEKCGKLEKENALLRDDNERLKRNASNDSSDSSNPPSKDQNKPPKAPNTYNGRKPTQKKPGAQPGHRGHGLSKSDVLRNHEFYRNCKTKRSQYFSKYYRPHGKIFLRINNKKLSI